MNNIKVVSYTPNLHRELSEFLKNVYPNRDKMYIDWWITNVDRMGEAVWKKTSLLMEGKSIVGCTTFNSVNCSFSGDIRKMYWEANTVINKEKRGKGLGGLLYEKINIVKDRSTVGFTKTAWDIQSKKMSEFYVLNDVYVYFLWNYFVYRIASKRGKYLDFPQQVSLKRHLSLIQVEDFSNFETKNSGIWLRDRNEILRDKDFLVSRFDEIYRNKDYIRYLVMQDDSVVGYIVVRKIVYKGMELLSLVDYRYKAPISAKDIIKALWRLMNLVGLGGCLILTSQKLSFFPYLVRTHKSLKAASNIVNFKEHNEVLITSADSDLDFVYYG